MPMFCAGDQAGAACCGGACWAGAAADAAGARPGPETTTKRTTKPKAARVAISSCPAVKWLHFLAFFIVVSSVGGAGGRKVPIVRQEGHYAVFLHAIGLSSFRSKGTVNIDRVPAIAGPRRAS